MWGVIRISIIQENGEIIEYVNREDLIKDPNSKYYQTRNSYDSKVISVEI